MVRMLTAEEVELIEEIAIDPELRARIYAGVHWGCYECGGILRENIRVELVEREEARERMISEEICREERQHG